jgi:hypothetical protein
MISKLFFHNWINITIKNIKILQALIENKKILQATVKNKKISQATVENKKRLWDIFHYSLDENLHFDEYHKCNFTMLVH